MAAEAQGQPVPEKERDNDAGHNSCKILCKFNLEL